MNFFRIFYVLTLSLMVNFSFADNNCAAGYVDTGITEGSCCTNGSYTGSAAQSWVPNGSCSDSDVSYLYCGSGGCYASCPAPCADIDECSDGSDTCDSNATCTNTAGSFTCECNAGLFW